MTALDQDEAPAAAVTAAEFRQAMGQLATGVTVVTTRARDGAPVGTTVSAVTALSLEPPLILVCLVRDSRTLEALRGHGAFAVNVLAARQRHLSANFARRGGDADWAGISHRPGPTGSPRLDGALGLVECTVEDVFPGGDHEIVIGRVRRAEAGPRDAGALVHWRGSYTSVPAAPQLEQLEPPQVPGLRRRAS
jgi:3-hydroxy-9,10-secoandrosta-1,3,5(10)-triene-9,17-dione monooxygenase reductase component